MAGFVVKPVESAVFEAPGPRAPGAVGMTRWHAVGEADGAVHSDFGVTRLDPGGRTAAHVHSVEESFHILQGEVVLVTPEATVHLRAGDYGVIPVAVPHSWLAIGDAPAEWSDLFTPPPRARAGGDTYRVPELAVVAPQAIDVRDPRTRSFGSISPGHMLPGRQSQSLLPVSASMRTALLVYSGISLKMMVDSDLGATLGTMFMVQYEPDGLASPHDHPLEEVYQVLDGEVLATFDGEEFLLREGDIAWAGVGCVHSFRATGAPVRWLETQSPAMPARHAYRFVRDWEHLGDRLESSS